mmetsp:Transcript_13565/g.36294  ORF Transcript_13565/g.36294 Transcript_13565/m.36294 type:complete len:320 (+) Transcript_13565:123-1082(+)
MPQAARGQAPRRRAARGTCSWRHGPGRRSDHGCQKSSTGFLGRGVVSFAAIPFAYDALHIPRTCGLRRVARRSRRTPESPSVTARSPALMAAMSSSTRQSCIVSMLRFAPGAGAPSATLAPSLAPAFTLPLASFFCAFLERAAPSDPSAGASPALPCAAGAGAAPTPGSDTTVAVPSASNFTTMGSWSRDLRNVRSPSTGSCSVASLCMGWASTLSPGELLTTSSSRTEMTRFTSPPSLRIAKGVTEPGSMPSTSLRSEANLSSEALSTTPSFLRSTLVLMDAVRSQRRVFFLSVRKRFLVRHAETWASPLAFSASSAS